MKTMQQKPKFVATSSKLGESWEMIEDLLDKSSLDDLRFHMLKEKGEDDISPRLNNDLSTLPPWRRSLIITTRKNGILAGSYLETSSSAYSRCAQPS